ncbi:MAG: hypothetical protein IT458_05600 [Planctomycetes bacterium]|nr:hypothetical protein [Planctomycetota bacterium]
MRFVRGWGVGLGLAVLGAARPGLAQEPIDFARQVLPVLEKHCFECHRAAYTDAQGRRRTPKGGLRLDGREWIAKGGDNGRVLVPGKPEQSELYTRTVLPEDHPDRMPDGRDALPARETEILRAWIAAGAGFGAWSGATGPEPVRLTGSGAARPAEPVAAWRTEVAKGLAPLAPEVLAKAAGGKARITPIAEGSPLLRVEFPGHEADVGDQDLAALAPLREHVAQLILPRARVTDRGMAAVARLPRLVHLDLRETAVGDPGVAQLGGLTELRVLNLFATPVTDAGVATLARLSKLESVYLWESEVTEAGLVRLRAALPGARIVGAPALPAPETDGAGARNPRRPR